ncbi:hypothetical protein [Actinomycetospora termitidis]|uniref:Secreted protein n=1 Tax=Actinomycetospora termitidis TaxID=3053470 RepID=A0ABT7MBR2_9PSEU|nr:hypothetical protein [Actinomycetospora sp. Odt1-22]MDL5157437.1 hypothetical protein [Actinomycetospora sp. Odt1-22]
MLLKKAGMVVIGAAAGVAALSGTAFAGDMPEKGGHDHSWDRDHGHGHHHGHDRDRDRDRGDNDGNATAIGGDCANLGDQLIGVNCVNVQAPISQLGVLSTYNNDDDGRDGRAGFGHGRDGRDGGGDNDGNATARGGDQINTGDQGLLGLNNVNIQAPISQLGVLSTYNN